MELGLQLGDFIGKPAEKVISREPLSPLKPSKRAIKYS